ncbi:thermonuclease family protein [Streptomyces sp. NPDC058657]|uniref:thermonuclease family protein n=1 Tax=unclassified Streptomyces TaxID=2593676 RepID=UPI00365A0530
MNVYPARLVRVIDADTLDVEIDLGFSIHIRQRVRLQGLNAPERNTADGKAAIDWVLAWFTGRDRFTVETHQQEKYGRWLATITDPDGMNLNAALLAEGYAASYDGVGPRPLPAPKER